MWSAILIDINMLETFKNRFCFWLLWSSQYYSWSIQAGSMIHSVRKYKHLLWFSTFLPLVFGSSSSKEISETMDLNEKNKINIGKILLKWNIIMSMKTVWNGFKLKLVNPSFLEQFLLWSDIFDISAKFCVF